MTTEKLEEAVELAKHIKDLCDRCAPRSIDTQGNPIYPTIQEEIMSKAILFLHEQVKELQKMAFQWQTTAMAIYKEIEDGEVVYMKDYKSFPGHNRDSICKEIRIGEKWTNDSHKARLIRVEPLK